MDTHTNTAAPTKKPTFGQRLKNMFGGKKKNKNTTGTVVEETHVKETHTTKHSTDKHAHEQVVVPPGPVMMPAVMIPVVGGPQENAQFLPQQPPQQFMQAPPQQIIQAPPAQISTTVEQTVLTEKQAFGSIIESRAMGARQEVPLQPIISAPAPIPVQQVPQPIVAPIPAPIIEAIPPPVVVQQPALYQPVGEIFPPPITTSVMAPIQPQVQYIENRTTIHETKPLTGAGYPIESGGMVYNESVIRQNEGMYIGGQQQLAPHLRNMVEITGTHVENLTNPRDLIVGPADKTNPVFMANLQNLKHDPEYISRHLAESNPAKPKPFDQLREYGKIPNPSYAGGKPFFVDMLYNPDPMVPLSQYPEAHHHLPLNLIGQKNAELNQINKMNEVQIKEHKEIMRSDPHYN